jgi:murein peptide amidase A
MGQHRSSCRYAAASGALVAAGALAAATLVAAPPTSYAGGDRPAVIEQRIIGRSVQGRAIRAWHVGNPGARRTFVVVAAMHGDEPAPRRTLWRLRDGAPIRGVDMWLVPAMNPDGLARRSRYNANGVDLNRNFPVSWRRQQHSGRRAASARETRVMMRFLREIRPDRIVSFHQPLFGVDTNGSKAPGLARRLSREMRLPRKNFDCGSGCHGTMTQWYNARFPGACVTVEYSGRPSDRYVTRFAPPALLRAIGASR